MAGMNLLAGLAGLGQFADHWQKGAEQRRLQAKDQQAKEEEAQLWSGLRSFMSQRGGDGLGGGQLAEPEGGAGDLSGLAGLEGGAPSYARAPPGSGMGSGLRAGAGGGDDVERFLDLVEHHESGGRNIPQGVVGPNGGYNPSVGRVTGPSSAQGYHQFITPTWREFAPQAGVDINEFPNAMRAPRDVQRNVARTVATTSGVQHWTDYNKPLRAAVQAAGLPVSGPIGGRTAATPGVGGAIGRAGPGAMAPAQGGTLPVLSPDYVFGSTIPRPDPNAAYFGGSTRPGEHLSGKSAAPAGRVDELTDPELAAEIDAAPAAGEPIPLDRPGASPPARQKAAPVALEPEAEAPQTPQQVRRTANQVIGGIPMANRGRLASEDLAQRIDQAMPGASAGAKIKFFEMQQKMLAPAEREAFQLLMQQNSQRFQSAETDRRQEGMETRARTAEAGRTTAANAREDAKWDVMTDPTNNTQYRYQKSSGKAKGLTGEEPYVPGGAQRLGGAGGATASAGREVDVAAEIKRLDGEFATKNPDATPAEKNKAHFDNRLAAEKSMTGAKTAVSRSNTNIVMRKLMDENPEWGGDDLLRAANKITAQQSIERSYGGGQSANQMRSLNTVADHLKLMEEYSRELRTGDTPFTGIPRLNQIIQFIAKEAGLPEVTNFNVARDIMADEVVRLLTSTGGTEADRAGMQSRLSAAMSEYQQTGSLAAFEKFVLGRFEGLEQGFARNDPVRTKEFRETMLTPLARDLFAKHAAGGAPAGRAAGAPPRAVPAGLPSPAGHPDGSTAKDASGRPVAVIRGGQWVPP